MEAFKRIKTLVIKEKPGAMAGFQCHGDSGGYQLPATVIRSISTDPV